MSFWYYGPACRRADTLGRVDDNIERVKMRADAGGHAASPSRIRATHRASLANVPEALREFDRVWVYDNTELGNPRLVLETEGAKVRRISDYVPTWLRELLEGDGVRSGRPNSAHAD